MMTKEEMNETLARIRKTLEESQAAIDAAGLRIQETDRMLARQGLTREQVLGFRFTREQKMLANEELRRRGLPPIEEEEESVDFAAATASLRDAADSPSDDILAERQRSFGSLMHGIRI